MEVIKKEDPNGTVKEIEFINTGDEDFKTSIKTWISDNYPTMDFQEFFDRLVTFENNACRINMT